MFLRNAGPRCYNTHAPPPHPTPPPKKKKRISIRNVTDSDFAYKALEEPPAFFTAFVHCSFPSVSAPVNHSLQLSAISVWEDCTSRFLLAPFVPQAFP
jgi:hypothetical protein